MPRPGHRIVGVQTVCQRCGTDCYQTMRCPCCRADERVAWHQAWDRIEYRRANPQHTATMWPNPTPH